MGGAHRLDCPAPQPHTRCAHPVRTPYAARVPDSLGKPDVTSACPPAPAGTPRRARARLPSFLRSLAAAARRCLSPRAGFARSARQAGRLRPGGLRVALFALAALLLAPPFLSGASAQAQEYTEVWSTTMTAGAGTLESEDTDNAAPHVGYVSGQFGTLPDHTFTFDGRSYRIREIALATWTPSSHGQRRWAFYLAFDRPWPHRQRAHEYLVFRVGGFEVRLSETVPNNSEISSSWQLYRYFAWGTSSRADGFGVTDLNWSSGDSIDVSLVVPNRPLFDAPASPYLVLSGDPPGYAGDSIRNVGHRVKAIHPGGETVRYTLEGRDAALFTIDENTGRIRTRAGVVYDYETETRSCTQYFHSGPRRLSPCYEATVRATATGGGTATQPVTIELFFFDYREVQGAPPEPLTARFGDLPTRHTGEAFTFTLEFGEEFPLTAQTLTSALGVTGGSVTAAEKVNEESSRNWRVTVTPSSAAEAVSVTLAPKESCDAEGAICTADGRTIPALIEAEVPARAATYITGVEVTSNPGANGVWDTGETVRVQVAFNAQVGVHGPPGSGPTLGIALDGARREAGYTGGSGTTTLTFEHAVTAADAGATRARVVANSLNLNGYVIGDTQGQVAGTNFDGAPELSVADAGGAEGTDAAIAFTVTLAPAAATEVTVHYATADGTATAPADYTSTSSTLTFEPGQTSKTIEVPIVDDDVEDDGETFTLTLSEPSGAVLADAEATGTIRNTETEAAPLTAEFLDLPDGGHGTNPFTVKLRLSEEFSLSYKTLQDHALGVTNGTLTGVSRVTQGEDRAWNVTVEPSGGGAVTVALAETTDCGATGAICAGDGRMLAAVSATVPETAQAPPPTPFRVSAGLPAEHDGTSEIVFEVSFNKRPQADYSYKTLRGETLRIRQGGASLTPKVRRLNAPHNDRWEVKVTPGSKEDLSVSIGPFTSCSDAGAVCTAADEVLSNRIDRTIAGPPGLSVADARVHESVANAAVEFAVTLSRASAATVTVAYATSDGPPPNGATAEDDYASRSGTLTFLAGETAKTVSVPVFADDHDEGEETLILTLSDPTGGAWLKDATAIGTIENTGPMPRAWLARFGRTVAEQVIDAVEGRFSASRRPGVEMRLAGRAIGSGSGAGAPEPEDEEARAKAAAEDEARSNLAAMTKWLQGSAQEDPGSGSGAGFRDGERAGYESRSVSARDLLTGTSFALTGEAGGAGSGTVSLWGRGAVSRFDGREGDLTLSGEVTSAMLGADWMRPGSGSGAGAWTAGLLVSHSRGEGSYRGADEGTVSSSLTGLYPYGRYMVNGRLSVWGVAGYGEGTLTLTPDGGKAMQTDMDLQMGAVGVRGVAVEAPAEGGVELAVTSDAMAVRTASEKTAGLMAAEADVTRLRLGLEGTWRGIEAGGGELVPRLEVGLRHDGGDAETGFGLDLGGGLSWSHPESGLAAELSGRGLLTHESRGFRDRGLSASFGWDPGRGSGRGPKLTLSQTVGASASGGMDALLGRETPTGLAANDNGSDDLANRRLNVGFGYGFPAFGDRFTSTPEFGLGLGQGRREYSLGWRLNLAQTGATALELRLQATRSESAGGAVNDNTAEHGIGFTVTARW